MARSEIDLKPDEVSREMMFRTAWKGVGEAVTKSQNLKRQIIFGMWLT